MLSSCVSSPELGPDLAGDSEEDLVLGGVGGSACCHPLPPSPPCCQRCPHLSVCLSPTVVAEADLAEGPPPWTPALPTSEVTVTDITANSITVTFREAQAAEGFFRDRSGKF